MPHRLLGVIMAALIIGCAPVEITRDLSYAPSNVPMGVFDLYKPKGAPKGHPLPCVLLVHGGAWRSGDKRDMDAYAEWLCHEGYAAVSINYRLTVTDRWPQQINDVQDAFTHIRVHAAELGLDPNRIAVSGISAGAHLSMLLALEGSPRPNCVLSLSGEMDLDHPGSEVMDDYDSIMTQALGPKPWPVSVLQAMSPVNYVHKGVPIFLLHADGDTNIYVKQGDLMADALRLMQADFVYVRLHSDCHGECWDEPEVRNKIAEFLAAKLR